MTGPWFHVAPIPEIGALARLAPEEARHAVGSRRRGAGETVVVFDGAGAIARARIEGLGRSTGVRILTRGIVTPPTPDIELLSALPKGDRQSALLGMATQLGLSHFVPLRCRRSIASEGAHSRERWYRLCREACKQSRQPRLPTLGEECTPEAWASAVWGSGSGAGHGEADVVSITYVLHPEPEAEGEGEGVVRLLESAIEDRTRCPDRVRLVVGPEGGFDDEELVALQRGGGHRVSLSGGILRIEAAAALGVGLLSQVFRRGPASVRWA